MNQKAKHLCLITLFLISLAAAQQTLQEDHDFRFAVQLENKGLFDIAALQFERFAETFPTSPQAPTALFRAGENYEKADSLTRASKAYLAVLLRYPQSPVMDRAQFNQAKLLANNNEYLQAGIGFDRIKVLSPESSLIPEAQVWAAESYLKAGEIQKAYDAAFYILENHARHPTRLRAYKAIADVHETKGDYTLAKQSLDRILGDRIEDEFAAVVYTQKAALLNKLGRFTQADSVLNTLIAGKYAGPIVSNAAAKLAGSLQEQRQFREAERVLNTALGKVEPQDKVDLWLLLGDNYYLQDNYSQAKTTYQNVADPSATDAGLYFYRLGMANKQLGDTGSALTQFEHVVTDTMLNPAIRIYAAMEYADLLAFKGRAVEGVRYLQDKVGSTNPTALRNELFLTIARLQEQYLQDYTGARQNYNAIIAGSPKSSIVDDAQYFAARSYENEGNYKNALAEYNRYLRYYPGGTFYSTCLQKVNVLRLITPAESKDLDDALNEILVQGLAANSRADALNSLAQYQIHSFHDYEKALGLLERAEREDSAERLDGAKLNYDKAFCHFVLYEKASQDNNPGKAAEHADKLISAAEKMATNYPGSGFTDKVEYWAAVTNAPGLDSGMERINYLTSFINKITNDSLKYHLQLQLVDEMAATNQSDDASLLSQQAGSFLAEIINGNATDELRADALYKQALLLYNTSRVDSSLFLLNRLLASQHSYRRVDGLYLFATISEEKGQYIDAQKHYSEIVDHYFYSPWASRADVKLISLLLKQGQYKEANIRMQAKEKTGVPQELKIFYPHKADDEALWLWAELVRARQSPQEAVQAYQQYLGLGRDAGHRADALFAIGELADEMNKQDMALGYFEECADSFPENSLGQKARVRTAQLYFDRGMYEPALALYTDMRNNLQGDLKKHVFAQQVICDYRLDKLNRAQGLVKQFKKEYDDRNAEARFLYEEGMYYMRSKDLSRAEKTLKSLAGKYDDVPEGARGDLGLARLYVAQTKTEDALERLTEIPEKYDDPDIVATAYLNLADFYYENRALPNTIHAAKQVLERKESGPMRAQALDLLINAHDDLGMRDQAIAYQREYIETFPHAPNILDRRIRIGTFLYYLKEYDRAVIHLKELKPLVSANDEGRVQFWIAESYAAAGLTEQSIIEYLKVRYQCKQHPKLPFGATALYKAGEGYQKLGNLPKAKEMYELVVRERGATDDIGRHANRKLHEVVAEMEKHS